MKYNFYPYAEYNWWYHFPISAFKNIWIMLTRHIKYLWQRAFRGYADCDLWSIDYYLATIIAPMLAWLAKNSCGYPGNGEMDAPEKWKAKLEEIAEGFEAAKRVIDDGYPDIWAKIRPWNSLEDLNREHTPEEKAAFKELAEAAKQDIAVFKKSGKEFIKWFFNLWD